MSAIKVSVKGWQMKDLRAFQRAAGSGDYDQIFEQLARCVVAWGFEGDPSNPASYDNLLIEEFQQVTAAVAEEIKAAFSTTG